MSYLDSSSHDTYSLLPLTPSTPNKDNAVEMEKRLRRIMDNMVEGCQIISFDFRYLYVNKAVEKQGRRTKQELLGRTMMEVYPGIEQSPFFSYLRRCMKDRILYNMENEFVFPEGGKGWFELRMEPIPDGVLIFSVDITERKLAEVKLKEAKLQDETILASIGEGLIVTDNKGIILIINHLAQEILGYTSKETVGQSFIDVITMIDTSGKVIPRHKRPMFSVISTSKPVMNMNTAFYKKKDGSAIPVSITVTPMLIANRLAGTVEVFRDISKEIAMDKAKAEFISIASHELRTPLGIAKWYLEALKEEKSITKLPLASKYLDEIYKNNERLLTLVSNLLSSSRIDQGKVKNRPHITDIVNCLQKIVEEMKIVAEKNDISLSLLFKNKKIPRLFIDSSRLQEVIENLIINAIKYNKPHGKVQIMVNKMRDQLTIDIKDTGIGISQVDKEKLFTKFFRSDKAVLNNTEGSGLGLYVCKSYVEGWGGTISVESKEGEGSTFSINIPLHTTDTDKMD